jgi:heme exporter protein B
MLYFRQILLILWKDLVTEKRTKESFSQMVTFALLVIVICNVAMQIGTTIQDLLPGIIWIAFTFAGILGLNQSFTLERENNSIQGVLLCPVDRSAIYLGKVVGNFLMMSLAEVILLPVMIVLFNLAVGVYLYRLGVIMMLGTFGFVIIGTLFASMTAHTRFREMLLPLLVFPIVIPVLIAAVKSTGKILAQKPLAETLFWLNFLCIFDLIFLGLAMLLFEYIIESD